MCKVSNPCLLQLPDWSMYMTSSNSSLSSHSKNPFPPASSCSGEKTIWWSLEVAAPTQWNRKVTRVCSVQESGVYTGICEKYMKNFRTVWQNRYSGLKLSLAEGIGQNCQNWWSIMIKYGRNCPQGGQNCPRENSNTELYIVHKILNFF